MLVIHSAYNEIKTKKLASIAVIARPVILYFTILTDIICDVFRRINCFYDLVDDKVVSVVQFFYYYLL